MLVKEEDTEGNVENAAKEVGVPPPVVPLVPDELRPVKAEIFEVKAEIAAVESLGVAELSFSDDVE